MRIIIIFSLVIIANSTLRSQSVGIGTLTPDSSAILDLESTNQGFLLPRMTTAQRNAIVNPAEGLQVYNLDDGCVDLRRDTFWSKDCPLQYTGINVLAANNWVKRRNVGGNARTGAVGLSISGKGYIGTGINNGVYKKDFWEYDPLNNTWTQRADFGGEARAAAIAFSIGDKGYIGTGVKNFSEFCNDFWEYSPTNNTWTQKANFAGLPRRGAVGFSMGNHGYIGTGESSSEVKRDFWEYAPLNNTWTQRADFGGEARAFASGFSVGNNGYLGTGINGDFQLNDFWEYDPQNNTWTAISNFAGGKRDGCSAFSIGNYGYLGLGKFDINSTNEKIYKKDFWSYDQLTNSWFQISDFGGAARIDAACFSIDSKGYVGTGGQGSNQYNDFWVYNSLSVLGQSYENPMPNEATSFSDPSWTTFGNELSTTLPDVNLRINGKLIDDVRITGALAIGNSSNPEAELHFTSNIFDRRKLILWQDPSFNNDHNFLGFGADEPAIAPNYGLRFQVPNIGNDFRFYAATNSTSSNNLFSILGSGDVKIYSNKTLEFGTNIVGKEAAAGKIGYQSFTTGALDIVGAGSTFPNRKVKLWDNLEVAGNAEKPGGGSWAASSDIRVKKNIQDYKYGLNEVLKIRPVTFQYNGKGDTNDNGKTYTGVIAQEIEKILPNTVSISILDDIPDMRTYDGSEIQYTLINAIKELYKENEALKKQNNEILKRILVLESKTK